MCKFALTILIKFIFHFELYTRWAEISKLDLILRNAKIILKDSDNI